MVTTGWRVAFTERRLPARRRAKVEADHPAVPPEPRLVHPRQPGGVIAGSIAYRHHRVQMFEGYAGASASGFRGEVEAEEAIARGEQLCDLITSHGYPS
jgi:hypothetical protein